VKNEVVFPTKIGKFWFHLVKFLKTSLNLRVLVVSPADEFEPNFFLPTELLKGFEIEPIP